MSAASRSTSSIVCPVNAAISIRICFTLSSSLCASSLLLFTAVAVEVEVEAGALTSLLLLSSSLKFFSPIKTGGDNLGGCPMCIPLYVRHEIDVAINVYPCTVTLPFKSINRSKEIIFGENRRMLILWEPFGIWFWLLRANGSVFESSSNIVLL